MTEAGKRFLNRFVVSHSHWMEAARRGLAARQELSPVSTGDQAAIEYYLGEIERIDRETFEMLIVMSGNVEVDEKRLKQEATK